MEPTDKQGDGYEGYERKPEIINSFLIIGFQTAPLQKMQILINTDMKHAQNNT